MLRLKPKQKLKEEIVRYCRENRIHGCFVVGCAGSLFELEIRLASAEEFRNFCEPLEIVSLQGSVCDDGVHLHISVSDSKGNTYGGHLVEGTVHTTAEILLISTDERYLVNREYDPATGYKELVFSRK